MHKTNRKVIFPSLHIYLCVNGVSGDHVLPSPTLKKKEKQKEITHRNRERGRVRGPGGPELIKEKMNISCSIILS